MWLNIGMNDVTKLVLKTCCACYACYHSDKHAGTSYMPFLVYLFTVLLVLSCVIRISGVNSVILCYQDLRCY